MQKMTHSHRCPPPKELVLFHNPSVLYLESRELKDKGIYSDNKNVAQVALGEAFQGWRDPLNAEFYKQDKS